MASNELKLRIVFAFALTALAQTACVCSLFIEPERSKFVIPVGTPLEIICNEISELVETIYWRRANGQSLNEGNAREQKMGNTSVILTFTNPTQNDSGEYYCESKFNYRIQMYPSSPFKKIIEIIFYNPELKFERSFENIFAEEGATLEVKCSAIGENPIHYEWRNQYQEVISSRYLTEMKPISAYETKNGSVLKILKINRNMTGSYTCKASNKYGLAKKEYEILILSDTEDDKNNSLPIIRHVKVVNVTSNSVQFGFSVSGTANLIRTRYYTDEYYHYDDTLYERVWKLGDIYKIKDLLPGISYAFKFKAVPLNNTFSESDNKGWSEKHRVVMLPAKPDVVFHELLGGSVQISWIPNGEFIEVYKYKLAYVPLILKKNTNYWTKGGCPVTIDIPFCDIVNYTISGLRSNMYYEIQLQAYTAGGEYGEAYTQKIYVK